MDGSCLQATVIYCGVVMMISMSLIPITFITQNSFVRERSLFYYLFIYLFMSVWLISIYFILCTIIPNCHYLSCCSNKASTGPQSLFVVGLCVLSSQPHPLSTCLLSGTRCSGLILCFAFCTPSCTSPRNSGFSYWSLYLGKKMWTLSWLF